MRKPAILAVFAAIIAALGFYLFDRTNAPPGVTGMDAPAGSGAIVQVTLPQELSDNAKIGERIFTAKCAACHGKNAAGVDGSGPPLVHKIYEPSHHGDASFLLAVRNGVRAHHWSFGSMMPVEGLTDAEVSFIAQYVRELQKANGIF